MRYIVSRTEIVRRRRAYLTLSTSLLVGLFLSSIVLKYPVTPLGYLIVGTAIFILGTFSFRFLQHLSEASIILTDKTLKREVNGITQEYSLSRIRRVKIKWTTNLTIREIYIWLDDGKSVFISALELPEQFRKCLLEKINKNVSVIESREPLDFDHPLFYSLLGLPISAAGVWVVKYIPYLDYKYAHVIMSVFALYLLGLGSYFVVARPLSRRYASKGIASDLVVAILMIGAATVIWLL